MIACEIVLKGMNMESQLNNHENILKILNRLPFQIKSKWIDRAYNITEFSGREANFNELCQFLSGHVKKYKTLFGNELLRETQNKNEKFKPHSVFAIESDQKKCICCDLNCSDLENCEKFKAMTQNQRYIFNRDNKLCNNCLKIGHFSRDCKKPKNCNVRDCKRKHHYLLHWWKPDREQTQSNYQNNHSYLPRTSQSNQTQNTYQNTSNINCASASCEKRKVAMSIVPVRILGENDKFIETYGLIDGGSDVTLCTEQLLRLLDIKGNEKHFSITTVNGEKQNRFGKEVDLKIQPVHGGQVINLSKVWTVNKLPISLQGLPEEESLKQWSHLENLELPRINCNEVNLLIGSDMPFLLCPSEIRSGKQGEPCAIKYPLGWVFLGPVCSGIESNMQHKIFNKLITYENISNETLFHQVERFWQTEFNDLKNHKMSMSIEDKIALSKIDNSLAVENGRYVLPLPWREKNPHLQNNLSLAYARLKLLKRKLEKNSEMHEKYKTTINEYLSKNHARKLTPNEISNNSDKIYYLPHHPVTNINKPGKVRVVFDCAAKYNGSSLNDQLLSGPDLVNNLVGVLIRFRQEKIAIAADIEGMFHQVLVQPDDSNALRFLWWKDGNLTGELEHYCMNVHLFGATSSPFCATYALKRTSIDQAEKYQKLTSKAVDKNFYVDDFYFLQTMN